MQLKAIYNEEGTGTNANWPSNATKVLKQITASKFTYDIWLFELDEKGKPQLQGLYRDGVVSKLMEMGYHKRYQNNNSYIFIKEEGSIIWEVTPNVIKDDFFSTAFTELDFKIKGHRVKIQSEYLREIYLLLHKKIFHEMFLEHVSNHEKPIFRDTKQEAFFFFNNNPISAVPCSIRWR